MKTFRTYLLSNVYRSPDDPVIDPPADDVPPAPVAGDPPEPVIEPPAPEPPKPTKQPWYLERLAEESGKVAREREAREAAERRANDAEALAARLQADPAAPKPTTQPQRQPTAQDPDFQAAVRRQASMDRLAEDSVTVLQKGNAEFPDFAQTRTTLNAVGALNDEFVADILAVDKDNAHILLDKLAKDPERAVQLTQMDTRRRIAELTRMSAAIAPKAEAPKAPLAPAPVSRAPKPAPALAPVGGDDDAAPLGDDVDDATWSANWDRTHKKRA